MSGEQIPELGYQYKDPGLLARALTHRSYGSPHNERLEFLGDSVVNCVVALELFQKFPGLSEGELSRLRANLVNQESLAAVAEKYALGRYIRLGDGEAKSGGACRPSILADTVEALIGAAFIDGGFSAARSMAGVLFAEALAAIDPETPGKDPKTLLQEYLQGQRIALPHYAVVATHGEAHALQFEVECVITALGIRSVGQGSSRRRAEQHAAQQAYSLASRR